MGWIKRAWEKFPYSEVTHTKECKALHLSRLRALKDCFHEEQTFIRPVLGQKL